MGYWHRTELAEPTDTIDGLERAALLRYYDAQHLLGFSGRRAGAMYLLGYSVEMSLKAAYFRLIGVNPAETVWERYSAIVGLPPATIRHHRILDLGRLLLYERQVRSLDLDPVFEGQLQRHTSVTELHWRETLRYRSQTPTPLEASELDEAATWMMIHREHLWS